MRDNKMTSEKAIFDENVEFGKVQAYFYEEMHPQIFNIIEQRRLQRVIGNLTKKVDRHLPALDIGCGTGNVTRYLQHCGLKVVACDISADMLKENGSAEYKVICDACALPFKDETFIAITAYSMIQHLPNVKTGLGEICRVAAKNSSLYFDRIPFLDTTYKRYKGLKGFVSKKFELLTWLYWLILNPPYRRRVFEYFIKDGRKHLMKNLKDISIEKVAPYFESSKKSTLPDIFSKCLKEAGITWKNIRYRNGYFIIGRKTFKSNNDIRAIKKFKILFIPTNSREVAQFNFVRRELEESDCNIFAIALNKNMEKMLQKEKYRFKRIKDYKTRNMLNILKRGKNDIIVTDFCGPIPNAFLVAANYMGVPALQIDDGVTTDYSALRKIHPKLLFLKVGIWIASEVTLRSKNLSSFLITLWTINSPLQFFKKAIKGIINLTYPVPVPSYAEGLNIAVMSPFAKDAYIKMDVPSEKIFVTGQPGFDMVRQKKFNKKQLMTELSIPENRGVVVLATQPLVGSIWRKEDREKFIEIVCSAMREFSDKQLVIKLHPDENIETYQKILANRGEDKAIVCRDIDLYELLHACDLLMTVHSTVALEAMIFDKTVITINLTGKPDLFPYAESGAAIGVYKEEDLVQAIRDALYNEATRKKLKEARKKFVYEHAYIQDGKASKRVANLIIQLIEDSKRRKNEA